LKILKKCKFLISGSDFLAVFQKIKKILSRFPVSFSKRFWLGLRLKGPKTNNVSRHCFGGEKFYGKKKKFFG